MEIDARKENKNNKNNKNNNKLNNKNKLLQRISVKVQKN